MTKYSTLLKNYLYKKNLKKEWRKLELDSSWSFWYSSRQHTKFQSYLILIKNYCGFYALFTLASILVLIGTCLEIIYIAFCKLIGKDVGKCNNKLATRSLN